MKYIITESSLDKVIKKYLNDMFDSEDLNYVSPYDFDDETGKEGEDENHIIFYIGDYDEDNSAFEWYDCEYFYEDSPQRQNQTCPVVMVNHPYDDDLSDTFGEGLYYCLLKVSVISPPLSNSFHCKRVSPPFDV